MTEKKTGIQAWMSSIRSSMLNDPCRQLFEEQVQTHAFLFLDDYLENILLSGPQQAPIIELVKTPSRKKNAHAFPFPERSNELSVIAENDESPRPAALKTSILPTLRAPSPLRPAPLGKRTSWLTKAREARAMEGSMTRSESDGTSNVPPMVEDVQGSAIPDERTKHEGQSLQSSVFSRPTKNRRVESGDNDFQCLAATSEDVRSNAPQVQQTEPVGKSLFQLIPVVENRMPDILELEKVRISTPKNEQSQERKSPPAIIVASQENIQTIEVSATEDEPIQPEVKDLPPINLPVEDKAEEIQSPVAQEVPQPEPTSLPPASPVVKDNVQKVQNHSTAKDDKVQPEVKNHSLIIASVKKVQEAADKKALRLKEMEARRQATLARIAEEERVRLQEEERRLKEESQKRKREREENMDKRQLRIPVSIKKLEDDMTKKRKVTIDSERKLEAKKAPTAVAVSQNASIRPSTIKPPAPEAKPFKLASSIFKGKAKAKPQEEGKDQLPCVVVQTQMAARVKAQIETSKQQPPEVPSESIELPDIHSEYSDSEDENRVRTFDAPDWAQSPELREALQLQSTVNPDDIFGAIRPLRMEEMFRTRQSRFRARTSSANWSGADRLTIEEVREYERRMGFHSRG